MGIGDHIGTCYSCGEHARVKELVKVGKFYLCECCHSALWHGGYSPAQMIKVLEETEEKRRRPSELEDVKRKAKNPITLDEQADFSYNWMKYQKEIFYKLGGSGL